VSRLTPATRVLLDGEPAPNTAAPGELSAERDERILRRSAHRARERGKSRRSARSSSEPSPRRRERRVGARASAADQRPAPRHTRLAQLAPRLLGCRDLTATIRQGRTVCTKADGYQRWHVVARSTSRESSPWLAVTNRSNGAPDVDLYDFLASGKLQGSSRLRELGARSATAKWISCAARRVSPGFSRRTLQARSPCSSSGRHCLRESRPSCSTLPRVGAPAHRRSLEDGVLEWMCFEQRTVDGVIAALIFRRSFPASFPPDRGSSSRGWRRRQHSRP